MQDNNGILNGIVKRGIKVRERTSLLDQGYSYETEVPLYFEDIYLAKGMILKTFPKSINYYGDFYCVDEIMHILAKYISRRRDQDKVFAVGDYVFDIDETKTTNFDEILYIGNSYKVYKINGINGDISHWMHINNK